jgi:superfamily II DNA or RNA helicase
MIEIEIVDPIESRFHRTHDRMMEPCLSFPAQFWRNETVAHDKKGNPIRRRVRKSYRKKVYTIQDNTHTYFYTGHLGRVKQYLESQDIDHTVQGKPLKLVPTENPRLPGVEFREDQISLIQQACYHQRGVIQAPTGTGKTILQLGIISCFPKCRVLILAHTIGIVQQTMKELLKFNLIDSQMITGKFSKHLRSDIVVSTMQSFVKVNREEAADYFDIVIIDEAHHVSKLDGTYAQILSNLLAPVRLGFTATMPTSDEAMFALEGTLGPLIVQQTIQEAAELEILAKPKVRLLRSRHNQNVKETRKYPDVYQLGIVENRQRNSMILSVAEEYTKSGKSVLILVTRIEHGENLQAIAERHFEGMPVEFVRGSTESDIRERVKEALETKQTKCVIATVIWREGINIPSLDVVINACGGKSEIMTIQAIGRGLRKTDDKDEVVIVDIFDPSHHYLISHFGHRVTLYMDQGWM